MSTRGDEPITDQFDPRLPLNQLGSSRPEHCVTCSSRHVTADRLEELAFQHGGAISMGGAHPTLTLDGVLHVADVAATADADA